MYTTKFCRVKLGIMVGGCCFAFISNGSFKSSGVLFDDTVKLYNTSNVFGGWVFSLQLALGCFVAAFNGAVLRNVSYRAIGVTGGFLFGLGFVFVGTFAEQLWQLIIFTGIAAVGAGLLYFAYYLCYCEHFKDNFSFWFSMRELFSFVGISLMPPLIEVAHSHYGFHGAYLILGAITWNSLVCGMLMRPPVQHTSVHNEDFEEGDSRQEVNNSLAGNKQNKDVFFGISCLAKFHSFVLLLFIHCIICYNFVSWALFLVPYGVSLGFRPDFAVFFSTAGGIGGFLGKVSLLAVFYCDVANTLVLFVVPAITFTVGLLGYIFTTNYFLLLVSSIISGFSVAFAEGSANAVLPQFICRCHLRQGIAFSYLCTGLFFQISGIFSGLILDVTSSFSLVFGVMIMWNIVMSVLAIAMFASNSPLQRSL